jgi:hypothetical protein
MSASDFFEEGKRFFVEGNYEKSIEAFTTAAEAGYEQTISYLSRGAAFLKLRRADEAIVTSAGPDAGEIIQGRITTEEWRMLRTEIMKKALRISAGT